MKRRRFLQALPLTLTAAPVPALQRELGITTGSFMRHLSETAQPGKLHLLDLPRIMRDELGMHVIDLMTATLVSLEPKYLEQLRQAATDAGCVLTNLKMNQKGLDMANADEAVRRQALDTYRKTIDAAALLGVRWVRPLPGPKPPDLKLLAQSYRDLIDYAGEKGTGVLIENFGWMQGDANAIPQVIQAVGSGLKAQPDTGNWTDAARYDGLAKAFPFAVSCDFKARDLAADGTHAAYDLKRCFDIGWQAGFRGPWCFEHFHNDMAQLFREMGMLRDMLRLWMKQGAP
ncbi:TIM barrel protein [Prosthecobacter sp.]|uniref:sugar phosphate isomerase/epimerase family protein n=1 Tax=Prosthecobacter sp. TaxID=1965333 RepID=UPI002ABC346C|nr:TIM barrel protein [Prosthecobacter sp.]MDZ4402397.1 TIM barrel protein [Prosthecobacter sp.]